jgi:hypothetical protein
MMPEGESLTGPLGQDFEFFSRAGRGPRGLEVIGLQRRKVFVMSKFGNGLKYVSHISPVSFLCGLGGPDKNFTLQRFGAAAWHSAATLID